ncbi:hypothetical protein A7K94_0218080 [Modestobacter sp. VKM Ac-2676]|nr:hypothetical protein A7K94_0218080 [Modestobacter sp. VKM Ac-2676]
MHGGPHNAWSPAADPAHAYHQALVAAGWTVLLVNPRGSDGYGRHLFTAAVGAWGVADERDFLDPVDQLVAEGVADPARLALTGYSYGGYMTCWLTGRTDRFAAAIAGGVVADLTSMTGTSDAGEALALEFGDPVRDPEAVRAHSPITNVHRVRTPTLVLHGAADERCPVGQAEQWFTALRTQRVPTELVLFPGGSHLFILDGRPPTGSATAAGSSTGRCGTSPAPASTRRTGSGGWTPWPPRTASPARAWRSAGSGRTATTSWSRWPPACSTGRPTSR